MSDKTFEDNREAIEAWNGVLFDKFSRFREAWTKGAGIHGQAMIERHPPRAGARVLDVGCGFGDTTLTLAGVVGATGTAVGVDAAARFIEFARRAAEQAGVQNASFVVADVEREPIKGPFDHAFSRFGTMFFANPVAALRNVRRSLSHGSILTMVVWRKKDENPFLADVERRVLELVTVPESSDEPTCGPGPFSMASPDVVSAQLKAASFGRITFERNDASVFMGKDVSDATDFAMALGPAGEVLRLAGADGEKKKPEVVAAIRELLAPLARPDGVFGASSSWLVTARAS